MSGWNDDFMAPSMDLSLSLASASTNSKLRRTTEVSRRRTERREAKAHQAEEKAIKSRADDANKMAAARQRKTRRPLRPASADYSVSSGGSSLRSSKAEVANDSNAGSSQRSKTVGSGTRNTAEV